MKDAVNDTIILDKLNSRLTKIEVQTRTALQSLVSELDKSSQYLEGMQFNIVKESVASAIATTNLICEDIKKAQEYIISLKSIIGEYSKIKF